MMRTGPVDVKENGEYVVGIKSVFAQMHQKNEAKKKLEVLEAEREKLLQAANAPLKRKLESIEADQPAPKRLRKESQPQQEKADAPQESKPKLDKPKKKPAKPAPKFKQPKLSAFFKKI